MSIANYDVAKEVMDSKLQTLLLEIRQSYDSALASNEFKDKDGLLDMSKVKENIGTLKTKVVSGLESKVKKYYGGSIDGLDDFEKARLMTARYGFASVDALSLIDQIKENPSFDAFYTMVSQGQEVRGGRNIPALMAGLKRDMMGYSASKLTSADAGDIINEFGLGGKVDPDKLTDPMDMANIIETCRNNSQYVKKFLSDKNYLVDGYDPTA